MPSSRLRRSQVNASGNANLSCEARLILALLERVGGARGEWLPDNALLRDFDTLIDHLLTQGNPQCAILGALMRDALAATHAGKRGVLHGLLMASAACTDGADRLALLLDARGPGLSTAQRLHALGWIAGSPAQRLTPSALAQALGMSRQNLVRAINGETGETPKRWLLRIRIKRARNLLTDPDLTLNDIALMCGFSSHAHFSRAFRDITGMTPQRWRKWRGVPVAARRRDLSGS